MPRGLVCLGGQCALGASVPRGLKSQNGGTSCIHREKLILVELVVQNKQ